MITNSTLISLGNFDLKFQHLLIIGVLVLAFSISFLLRVQPADAGFTLNEFDPFFNYRATQYIVDNGITEYYNWNDELSWHPHGRDISAASQVALHMTAAATYSIFGGGSSLYDFTVMFPVVFSSLSAIVIFALVRVLGGTTAGLYAALLYSISLPILIRSPIGWFKSEPLGIFFSLLFVYLLLSGINTKNKRIAFTKLVGAGIITTFALSSWGGNQFFIIPIGIFFIALPFLRSDNKFIVWAVPLYTITLMLTSLGFERTSSNFVFGLGGLSLITSTLISVSCILIQIKSPKHKIRNSLIFLAVILVSVSVIFIINSESQFLPHTSHRYANALNPFLTTTDPLVDSVSEHATTNLSQSFLFHSVLMIFSGLGIWLIIKNLQNKQSSFIKSDMLSFALIIGMVGVYVSSTFVRLEVFGSISLIILASLGLSILSRQFFKNTSSQHAQIPVRKLIQLPFAAGVILLLVTPLVYPVEYNTILLSNTTPTILNGGTIYPVATTDWTDALAWLEGNTPQDAVVAAWWDYGYWISTLGDRATLADNSTISTSIIQNIARLLLSSPDSAWGSLNQMQADYVLVFVAGEKLNLNLDTDASFYTLGGGGDESKKQWFMRIAEDDLGKYLHADGLSGTDYFWNETLLGQLFPFSLAGYVNPNNLEQQYRNYVPGTIGIYEKDIKFAADDEGPFRLVYASPGFTEERIGPMIGVFIYEINKDYVIAS